MNVVAVAAQNPETLTHVVVVADARYKIEVPPKADGSRQTWKDGRLPPCTAAGMIPPFYLWVGYVLLRMPRAPWFSLLGKVNDSRCFLVGDGLEFTAPRSGELLLFVNDVGWFGRFVCRNNSGEFTVHIDPLG